MNLEKWLGVKRIRILKEGLIFKGKKIKRGMIITFPEWYARILIQNGVAEELEEV